MSYDDDSRENLNALIETTGMFDFIVYRAYFQESNSDTSTLINCTKMQVHQNRCLIYQT